MVGKLSMLIVALALTAASLLVVRQQRLTTVREMADAAQRAAEFDRKLWRVRVEIAGRITPREIRQMLDSFGPMTPIPVIWPDAPATRAEYTPALDPSVPSAVVTAVMTGERHVMAQDESVEERR